MRDVVITSGYRTPFAKAGSALKPLQAFDLASTAIRELVLRSEIPEDMIDEVIIGNVIQEVGSANMARISTIFAGLPDNIPAATVNRNCASGMESISQAYEKIAHGEADVIIAGGAESMSQIPIFTYSQELTEILMSASKAKSAGQRVKILSQLRPNHLKPDVVSQTDPLSNLTMGGTAEVLAREFSITRAEQDEFALMSHQRASAAREKFTEEIVPVFITNGKGVLVDSDIGPRADQKIEQLAKLRPVFDKRFGSVTAGNASPITDGGAAVLVMAADTAKKLGYEPLGYIRSYAYAGLSPSRMGLGPAFATPIALEKAGVKFKNIELIEMNEAFAAQVIANERAFASKEFAKELGLKSAIGEINRDILNVNGGAIALGHPLGATGTRLILTMLKEMGRRNQSLGLATLCIGGGQGAAFVLERK